MFYLQVDYWVTYLTSLHFAQLAIHRSCTIIINNCLWLTVMIDTSTDRIIMAELIIHFLYERMLYMKTGSKCQEIYISPTVFVSVLLVICKKTNYPVYIWAQKVIIWRVTSVLSCSLTISLGVEGNYLQVDVFQRNL